MEKPNFGLIDLEEDSGDENNIIKFPFDSISTNNSESMELIKNCKNEALKDFINEKIKNYNYISTKQEKNNENLNLRRLSKIFNVKENDIQLLNNLNNSNHLNINNIRNLVEEKKYEVLQQKIIYAYSLAKTNVAGLKFEIMVIMSFSPQNGEIKFQVVCRTDKAQINIKSYEIKTNYGELINVISKITEIFNNKIIEFKNIFKDKLNNKWKKNISKNLQNLINTIKDSYNMIYNVGNPITNYLDILKGFLNQTKFSYFSNKLNIQLNNIKNSVNNLINSESDIIDESLNLVKQTLPDLFNSNKNSFKTLIDNSLLKLYDIIMPYVNNVDENNSDIFENVNIGIYEAVLPGKFYINLIMH